MVLSIILFVSIFLIFGTIVHLVMGIMEKRKYSPPGEYIKVDRHKMHIYGKGEKSPTVLMTAGWGTVSPVVEFHKVQDALVDQARTVIYERPGYGWSQHTIKARAILQMTHDLHQLLEKSQEEPPYILVGHGMGSMEVLHYAQRYPEEVAGVVIVDGGNPQYYSEIVYPLAAWLAMYFIRFARKTGLVRFIDEITALLGINKRLEKFSGSMKKYAKWAHYTQVMSDDSIEEMRKCNENAEFVLAKGKIGDIPLIVLTAEHFKSGKDSALAKRWFETQKSLAEWSTKGRQEIVPGSTHTMHLDQPEPIVEAILELVEEVKTAD